MHQSRGQIEIYKGTMLFWKSSNCVKTITKITLSLCYFFWQNQIHLLCHYEADISPCVELVVSSHHCPYAIVSPFLLCPPYSNFIIEENYKPLVT